MLSRRNLIALIATGAAAGGAALILPRVPGGGPVAFDLGAANAQAVTDIPDMTLGDPGAPVKVIEYASFTCPHCADFHTGTFKQFKTDYIDTGRVHFTYREVFFDRYGLWASMVARCAGPERYFGVADLIYRSQDDWARQADPVAVADSLKRIGLQAGLSQADLDACLADAGMAENLYAWYQANSTRDDVRSTPTFLINGESHTGAMSLSQLGGLVDDAS